MHVRLSLSLRGWTAIVERGGLNQRGSGAAGLLVQRQVWGVENCDDERARGRVVVCRDSGEVGGERGRGELKVGMACPVTSPDQAPGVALIQRLDAGRPTLGANLLLLRAVAFLALLARGRNDSFQPHVRDHVAVVFVVMRGVGREYR
jgi:hypothetical protein